MNTKHTRITLSALIALMLLGGVGCTQADDGMKPEEKQLANRLDEITKKSGGDWNKLSAEEKEYMIKDVAQGSEQSARMLLQARGGRLQQGPRGGAPRNAPGGPQPR